LNNDVIYTNSISASHFFCTTL